MGDDKQISAVVDAPLSLGALQTQIEYYLSDGNLQHDKFFHQKISSNAEGWLDLCYVLSCNKIKAMGATPDLILNALRSSDIEVREDGTAIRRADNAPLPALHAQKEAGNARK